MDLESIKTEQVSTPKEKNFIDTTYNALLSVEKPKIPQPITEKAKELNLNEKSEIHISVIASKNGKKIFDFLATSTNKEEVIEQIKNKFLNEKWEYELLPEYFLMEKHYNQEELEKSGYKDVPEHNRYTLVQKIKMDALKNYYQMLSELTNINFELPLSHITLYSGSDYAPMADRGIGIYSEKDFDKYLKSKL